TPLVLDERHDLLADPPQERLDLAALRGLVRCDPAVHLAEYAVKRERLGALLFGQLLRHQKRKEEAVLRQNVRRETRVSPGMVRWVLVISVRQDDDLLELALRSRGVGRSGDDVHRLNWDAHVGLGLGTGSASRFSHRYLLHLAGRSPASLHR